MTTVAPAAQSILDQATALWPKRSRVSDGTIGDAAHAARTSDHNPDSRGIVHAADLTHDPANGCDAHYWADQARQRAKAGAEPRLKYVISMSRIASPNSGWNWVGYDGSNPHEHHAHFSVNSGPVENDDSPWFVGADQGGLMPDEVRQILDAEQDTRKLILEGFDRILTAEWNTRRKLRDAGLLPDESGEDSDIEEALADIAARLGD